MCKLSVIVPVYNAEKYLATCLDTILNQSLREIEVLLINDGSTDQSGAICNKFAKHDQRITVIHTDNSGPSKARNIGIQRAVGKYLMFIDADDYIIPDTFTILLEAAEKDDCSLVVYPYFEKKDEVVGFREITECHFNNDEGKQHFLKHVWLKDEWLASLVNKLYRTDIIKENQLSFNEKYFFAEDYLFNLQYIDVVDKGVSVNIPLYYYVRHEDSVSSKIVYNKYEIALAVLDGSLHLLRKYRIEDQVYLNKVYNEYATGLVRAIFEPTRRGYHDRFFKKLNTIKQCLNAKETRFLFTNSIDLTAFHSFVLFCLKYKQGLLYYLVFKLVNKRKGL